MHDNAPWYHLTRRPLMPTHAKPAPGKLRIIGGSLRGSKLEIPDLAGLRPTPDRVRETLFNWLMPVIQSARCVDLFAGTGALGIEALSRGAAAVDFVETDAQLAQLLRANLQRLGQQAHVYRDEAEKFLAASNAQYDIAFLDPPFSAQLWAPAAQALLRHDRLQPGAWLYVESPAGAPPELPADFALHRENRAGAVRYALYRRSFKL